MDAREAELRQLVKKALWTKGSLSVLKHVMQLFEKYDVMKPPKVEALRLEVPCTTKVPWAVQHVLWTARIPKPWTEKQIKWAKQQHLENRNDGDRIYSETMGYEEWLQT